ncbi:carbohydrate esterase [Achlya hypogyna]|uniref:Carbohydrate esterase n=1 Tax=Achlya hypogyna TaxID=1202772 RepID=A0A1V9YYL6_ACHHY|nr:carbohydrate esterase [Achlya hypogyna]
MKVQAVVAGLAYLATLADGQVFGLSAYRYMAASSASVPRVLTPGLNGGLDVTPDMADNLINSTSTTAAPTTTAPKSTSLIGLLQNKSSATTPAPTPGGTIKNLDPTDALVILEDQSGQITGRRRLGEQDRDYTMHMLFCHTTSNSIQSYQSESTATTSPVYNPLLSTSAQGQCGKYIVRTETVASQVGCNPQNNPGGCNQTYTPGCGGIAINPKTKETIVARTGGRTIGRLVKTKDASGKCQSRVVDWLVRYRGKSFNSPSDTTYTSAGHLYFTDSPFGLASTEDELLSANLTVLDSKRALPFNGVYLRPANGSLQVVDCAMTRPKSIAFSPLEDTIYIGNADVNDPYIKTFKVAADGTVSCPRRFFDLAPFVAAANQADCSRTYPTSIKVDDQGFVYVAMCRNVYIISSKGDYVGRLQGSGELRNIAFSKGYLYLTATGNVYALPIDIESENSQGIVAASEGCDAPAVKAASNQSTVVTSASTSYTAPLLAAGGVGAVGAAMFMFYKRKQTVAEAHNFSPISTPRNHF